MNKLLTREVKIGLVAVVALAITVYGINWLKGIQMFRPSSYIFVKFSNANGLTESSPVFADGVRVGVVRSITYDYNHPGNIIVETEVDTDLRIPKGSSAELVSDFMGSVRMNLLLANNPREKHTIGDTLPGTLNAGMMAQAAELMPQLERMLPKLDSLLGALNRLANDPSISESVKNIQMTTSHLSQASKHLSGFMGQELPQLTAKLNTTLDNVVLISDNLKQVDYAAMMDKIDATLGQAHSIAEKMNSKESSLGLLLNDTQLYDNLNATSHHAAALLEDLKSNPKRYVHFSIFGRKK
ncbi:MAG: MlaD family protein [Bacteroides sp.]|nr:MlaD family protein [Bacteroides sp.]